MNKKDLKNIRKLKVEIAQLQKEIDNWPTGIVSDWAKDYRHGEPRTISIVGEADCSHLKKRLEQKLGELQERLLDMEAWVDTVEDSEIKAILRLKYRNGMTYEQIGEELGYTAVGIRQKISRFWKKQAKK